MQPSEGSFTRLLKKILFRQSVRHPRLQRLWERLHTLAIFGMNYGGGGLVETSGEIFVLAKVIGPALENIQSPIVFDVGAHFGDYSSQVRRHIPRSTVYAFEPGQFAYSKLVARAADPQSGDRIKTFNIGFSDFAGTAELLCYKIAGTDASLLSSIDLRRPTQVADIQTGFREQIQVTTIDSVCDREGIDQIDLLKLDVEGHELAVLRGARRLIEKRLITMIQFEFGPANIYSRTYFYDFWSMLSGGYDIYRILPAGIAPVTHYDEHCEVFLTTNYLAITKSTA